MNVGADADPGDNNLNVVGDFVLGGNMTVANGGTIGQAAGPLLTFDNTGNDLEITGCNVGIGTTTPARTLHIAGATAWLRIDRNDDTYGPALLFVAENANKTVRGTWLVGPANLAGSSSDDFAIIDYGTAIGGGSGDVRLVIDNTSGNVGVGVVTATAQLHVDQAASDGARPVLRLDQADVDDTFIDFIGATAADGTRSISSDTTEESAKFGAIRVEINGVTKWIRVYDDES